MGAPYRKLTQSSGLNLEDKCHLSLLHHNECILSHSFAAARHRRNLDEERIESYYVHVGVDF